MIYGMDEWMDGWMNEWQVRCYSDWFDCLQDRYNAVSSVSSTYYLLSQTIFKLVLSGALSLHPALDPCCHRIAHFSEWFLLLEYDKSLWSVYDKCAKRKRQRKLNGTKSLVGLCWLGWQDHERDLFRVVCCCCYIAISIGFFFLETHPMIRKQQN